MFNPGSLVHTSWPHRSAHPPTPPTPICLNPHCTCSRKFSKPPIGPVGAHLTLTDAKWAVAGEVVLGGSLELWIVDNPRDLQVCCAGACAVVCAGMAHCADLQVQVVCCAAV